MNYRKPDKIIRIDKVGNLSDELMRKCRFGIRVNGFYCYHDDNGQEIMIVGKWATV